MKVWWAASQSPCSLTVPKRARRSAAPWGDGPAQVGGPGAAAQGGKQGLDDGPGVVDQQFFGQGAVVPERALDGDALGYRVRQRGVDVAQQGDEIHRLPPSLGFLGAPGAGQVADHRRQYVGGVGPTDDVQALEGLVDEIQGMAAVGEDSIRGCDQQHVRQAGRWGAGIDSGKEDPLRALPVAHRDHPPEPAL